jgi:hypothetical protein
VRGRVYDREGAPPHLEVSYDAANGYLLKVGFTIDRKESSKTETELQIILMKQLIEAGAVDSEIMETFMATNSWEAQEE